MSLWSVNCHVINELSFVDDDQIQEGRLLARAVSGEQKSLNDKDKLDQGSLGGSLDPVYQSVTPLISGHQIMVAYWVRTFDQSELALILEAQATDHRGSHVPAWPPGRNRA
ncbi:hypothetical protein CLF_107102 [Clonorchis sinensis]|uniref:Uncharacterized protein n=1 Tax=Clonorchis sinensis TaxID=79923 RepID=G7YQF4_CLOSI|nr:hypothetical protein CLF_107102 [Clonorchis sinensis]